MQDRVIKTKILHVGLMLVLAPLVIDIGCLIWLYDLNSKTEKLAEQGDKISDILRLANNVMTLHTVLSAKFINFGISNQEPAEKARVLTALKADVAKLQTQFQTLMELTKDQPAMHDSMADYQRISNNEISKLLLITDKPISRDSLLSAFNTIGPSIRHSIKQASIDSDLILRISEEQQQALLETRQAQVASREQAGWVLLLIIAINTFGAAIVARWFFVNVTNRLWILVDNARRLSKVQSLNQHVTGTDELSYLDTVLHEAATDLRNATEQRQYLMDMVGHDLRSPLMSSQVALEILADARAANLSPLGKRQLDSLSRNVKRLTALTSDLLTVDKLEAGKLEITLAKVDLKEAVDESIESLEELAKKRKILLVNECPLDEIIPVDKMRIGQVLTNLLSNAIKFSPENESITVKSLRERESITIFVIDKGPGIAIEDQEKVFEKYGQLENGTGKGFGLGLAICRFIVEAHGGTISVKSKPGQGCMFWFRVPTREVLGAPGPDPELLQAPTEPQQALVEPPAKMVEQTSEKNPK